MPTLNQARRSNLRVIFQDLAVDEVAHVLQRQLAPVELERHLADGLGHRLARHAVKAWDGTGGRVSQSGCWVTVSFQMCAMGKRARRPVMHQPSDSRSQPIIAHP